MQSCPAIKINTVWSGPTASHFLIPTNLGKSTPKPANYASNSLAMPAFNIAGT